MLTKTLAIGDSIKVLEVVGNTRTYYPDGMDNHYTVDAAHAGAVTIYFRPAGNHDWAAFGGYIYIEAGTTAITNTAVEGKAVKMIKNGMLMIEKGGKLYNVMGTLIK
jgi:hypothetical protein